VGTKNPCAGKSQQQFSSQWVSELENICGSVVNCCNETHVAEAGDSLGTHRKGNVHCWKLLSSNGSEDVTVDIRVDVIMKCKV
jgi:hypothetical protein